MHLNKLATKLAHNIGILCKLKHFLPSYILKMIYCSLVLPHLQYCTLIWANTYSTKLNKIRMLQKKAVRIINNSDYLAHSEPLFKQNNLLKIEDIYKLQLGLLMYKLSREALPNSISILFQRNIEIHNHNTRNSNDYFMHEARTNTRKFTIKYSGPLFWNSIPEHIQNSTSENQFKNKLKQRLLSTYCNMS